MQILQELVQISHTYPDEDLHQFKSLVSAYQYKKLHELALKYLDIGSRVLDWGCGNGHFSYFLTKTGYITESFEFKKNLLINTLLVDKQANSTPIHFTQATMEDTVTLPYPSEYFDGVFSVGVLEHVREYGGEESLSLQEIKRILKPGGYFICYHLPNQWSWIENLATILPGKYHHSYRYTQRSITQLCQAAQLNIIALERYAFLPRSLWGKAPKSIQNSSIAVGIWNSLDSILERIIPIFCQNYWFIAQKPK